MSSGFTKQYVDVRIYRYGEQPELTDKLRYSSKNNGVIDVPKGFKTDFASIPRILWSIIAPTGKHTNASILHDYLYTEGYKLGIDRKRADLIFYEAMIDSSVARFTANVMWFAVRVFGKWRYNSG